jgi:hypothetical protein
MNNKSSFSGKRPAKRIVAKRVPKPKIARAPRTEGISRPFFSKSPKKGAGRVVGAAVAYSSFQESAPPKMFRGDHNSCRIIHRELVANVVGTANYSIVAGNTLSINPGMAPTFPWLSGQAQNWEQYRFRKLRAVYYTRTGSATPGSVQIIPDYDAADVPPASEFIAASYEDTAEDVPWKDITCDLRPEAMFPMGSKKYIRNGALAANLDIKTYDAATLFVATTDGSGIAWGKLWLEYDVDLFTPQTPAQGSNIVAVQHITGVTPTTASMLGAQTLVSGTNLATVVGEVVTFNQVGEFLLTYQVQTGNTATQAVTPTGVAWVNSYGLNGTGRAVAGTGYATMIQSMMFTITAIGQAITFNNTISVGTFAELTITQVPLATA